MPTFKIECAFTTDPGAASPSWTDISAYVKTLHIQRGRQHELDVIQTGTCAMTLNNSDRRFDPANTGGPYYPNVLPIRKIRVSATLDATTYRLFTGYVERWPRQRQGTTWSEIQLDAVDGFEVLGTLDLTSATASLTTSLGVANSDLTYTAVTGGPDGNLITITYTADPRPVTITIAAPCVVTLASHGLNVNDQVWFTTTGTLPTPLVVGRPYFVHGHDLTTDSFKIQYNTTGGNAITTSGSQSGVQSIYVAAPQASISGSDITVQVSTDSVGTITGTANGILTALQAEPTISTVVDVTLAPGSTGVGVVTAMGTTSLAGGTFVQQLSGARVTAVLDSVGWPAADRVIDTGISTIQESTLGVAAGVSALAHIQDVTSSETGLFFMDGQGRAVFHDRHALILSPYTVSQATFSDSPTAGQIGYTDLVPSYDKDLIFNDWQTQRQGATTTQEVSDSTSITRYFKRSQSLTPITADDNDALYQIQYQLGRFKDPLLRFDSITVKPGKTNAAWVQVLGREIGDRITTREASPPGGGAAVVQDCNIAALDIQISGQHLASCVCTWSLLPADTNVYLTLNDATAGKLNTAKVAY